MTRDDILRMAREAGLHEDDGVWYSRSDVDADVTTDDLERFAAIVAAEEREACARVCDELDRRWINQAEKCAERIRARSK